MLPCCMPQDIRYNIIRILLDEGLIKEFKSIFIYVPYTTIARDLHISNGRMKRLIANPEEFTFEDIITLADLIACDSEKLGLMFVEEVEKKMNNKKLAG